jgi:predicted nucleotidyltransferase
MMYCFCVNITQKQRSDIERILQKRCVRLAYVFGSYSHGIPGPLSDFDIAVIFGEGVREEDYLDYELKLAGDIGRIVEQNRVDVVNLVTEHSPLLKHRAVFYGVPILVLDEKFRFDIEKKIRQEYEDTEHLRSVQYAHLKKGLGIEM